MVVYVLHGFRWPRVGTFNAPGIRAHIVSYNLLDAAAEYLQEPGTSRAILQSFKRIDPNIPYHLPGLQLIEQYDPSDLSDAALSQPYVFVAAKVITMPDEEQPGRLLSLNISEMIDKGPELSPGGPEALRRLRDFLAPEEKIGWWVVYNGDPERPYPKTSGDDDDDDEDWSENVEKEADGEEGTSGEEAT
ncbi:hypothetical protein LOZ58_001127 [Ophidiomyces ophidiicola]|nr:hypothetical protein LOZ65_001052 [Ophidiomyces ophidiicola]KAI1937253.1 hypothetical protein LOZ66_004171 [Ophidiomyces ophidiicola]KAI1965281.1 hypothetical protein LOZ58_001127 [Ophidiomyces ophidiicola]